MQITSHNYFFLTLFLSLFLSFLSSSIPLQNALFVSLAAVEMVRARQICLEDFWTNIHNFCCRPVSVCVCIFSPLPINFSSMTAPSSVETCSGIARGRHWLWVCMCVCVYLYRYLLFNILARVLQLWREYYWCIAHILWTSPLPGTSAAGSIDSGCGWLCWWCSSSLCGTCRPCSSGYFAWRNPKHKQRK